MSAKLDPTIVLGAVMDEIGGAYRVGSKDTFIMEACEYQDSFLSFTPNIAVILNIDLDHTDYFSGLDNIIDSFSKYAAIADDGYAVYNSDSENVLSAMRNYKGKRVTFGLESDAVFTAGNIVFDHGRAEFDILKKGTLFAHIKLGVTGRHNILNSPAAAAAADICGVPAEAVEKGLASYRGAKRRWSTAAASRRRPEPQCRSLTITRTTRRRSARRSPARRRWVISACGSVFQPHTYSRTASLYDEFAKSFVGVNAVFAQTLRPARETDEWGVTSEKLRGGRRGLYLPTLGEIAGYLRKELRDGDVLIVMGAGDVIQSSMISCLKINPDEKTSGRFGKPAGDSCLPENPRLGRGFSQGDAYKS